jgi:hypothetical protein
MEYTCKRCNQTLSVNSVHTNFIVCNSCNKINVRYLSDAVYLDFANPTPDDLSLIKIGTELNYEKKKYIAIGRYRHHLKNSYLNHWVFNCTETDEIHVFEQLGNYTITNKSETQLSMSQAGELKAGNQIELNTIKEALFVENVDKNSLTHYSGEIAELNLSNTSFFYIYLNNNLGDAALVFIYNNKSQSIYTGKYGSLKDFDFININLISI